MADLPHDPNRGDGPAAVAAATVVCVRDGEQGLETLLLRRSRNVSFAGGLWVWPGGRIDDEDLAPGGDGEAAARRAAVREAAEEAGLTLDPSALVWFSHWIPPGGRHHRYSTWFFAAPTPPTAVEVDGSEIDAHRWITPQDALAEHGRGQLGLSPPTWITLHTLAAFDTVSTALTAFAGRSPQLFATRFAEHDGEVVAMYAGDAGYDETRPELPGPRHRLWIGDGPWRYERSV